MIIPRASSTCWSSVIALLAVRCGKRNRDGWKRRTSHCLWRKLRAQSASKLDCGPEQTVWYWGDRRVLCIHAPTLSQSKFGFPSTNIATCEVTVRQGCNWIILTAPGHPCGCYDMPREATDLMFSQATRVDVDLVVKTCNKTLSKFKTLWLIIVIVTLGWWTVIFAVFWIVALFKHCVLIQKIKQKSIPSIITDSYSQQVFLFTLRDILAILGLIEVFLF